MAWNEPGKDKDPWGGRGGGKLPTGRHIAAQKNTPLCTLYVSMLDAVGAPVMEFGDSQGPLAGLS